MEDVAKMLNEVAGGLQQSFGTIFERVGQSLEQSAQMMQMMNSMMEAALLQNLVVSYDLRVATDVTKPPISLVVSAENRSQIQLADVILRVRLGNSDETVEQALEQGLGANSTAIATFPINVIAAGSDGTVQIAVRSPGTQQWLQKEVQLRIFLLKIGQVEAVRHVLEGVDSLVRAFSDRVPTSPLREVLGVSAFDPLLIASAGHYCLHLAPGTVSTSATTFAISIEQSSESPSGVRVTVATERGSDSEFAEQLCQLVVHELESL